MVSTYDLVLMVREDAGIDTFGHALAAVRASARALASQSLGLEIVLRRALPGTMPETVAVRRAAGPRTVADLVRLVAAFEGRGCAEEEVEAHLVSTAKILGRCEGGRLREVEPMPPVCAGLFWGLRVTEAPHPGPAGPFARPRPPRASVPVDGSRIPRQRGPSVDG